MLHFIKDRLPKQDLTIKKIQEFNSNNDSLTLNVIFSETLSHLDFLVENAYKFDFIHYDQISKSDFVDELLKIKSIFCKFFHVSYSLENSKEFEFEIDKIFRKCDILKTGSSKNKKRLIYNVSSDPIDFFCISRLFVNLHYRSILDFLLSKQVDNLVEHNFTITIKNANELEEIISATSSYPSINFKIFRI